MRLKTGLRCIVAVVAASLRSHCRDRLAALLVVLSEPLDAGDSVCVEDTGVLVICVVGD